MAKIDRNGDLWIPTSTLKTFKSGEVRDLIFKDEATNKNKRIGIYVETELVDGLRYYRPKSTDYPNLRIIQYTTI